MEQEYTIIVFTENFVGLLNRITIIFTRRHINIESLTVSPSEVKGIHRFTIVLNTTEDKIIKLSKQIEKLVEVLKCFYYTNDEVIYQEIALYKVKSKSFINGNRIEEILRKYSARVLRIEADYTVIEKTGYQEETQMLFEELEPFGMLQFVRSGRVAITKEIKQLTAYLRELESAGSYSVIRHPEFDPTDDSFYKD